MALLTMETVKNYLRLDSADDDALLGTFISAAQKLCADLARLTESERTLVEDTDAEVIPDDVEWTLEEGLSQVREIMGIAELFATAYLFEHREEANHHDLTLTLRAMLGSVREGRSF